MPRHEGKVAIVTGAANGIGRAIAERFAAEGAVVVLGDIEGEALARVTAGIAGKGGTAEAVTGDLTEEAGATRLIDAANAKCGRIDILVNNLGGSRNAKIWEMSVADFDFVLRLNLRSTFLVTRAAAPHMMKRRQGRIICLSSGAREGTPWTAYYQGGAAYSMAKAGVHGFIRDVALELAEYNITVNAVAPGPIDTERTGPGLRRLDATVETEPEQDDATRPARHRRRGGCCRAVPGLGRGFLRFGPHPRRCRRSLRHAGTSCWPRRCAPDVRMPDFGSSFLVVPGTTHRSAASPYVRPSKMRTRL
jgi:NAD(P)-dependent dehydrogenase (short-subunit alcohol dehydrogenase family)